MMPERKRFFYYHFKGMNLKKLFKKWSDILKSYERRDPSDLPYWYYERTNIGLLSLAGYDLKGFPMQEFYFLKRGAEGEDSNGRADLYICMPKSNTFYDINIEAKQLWVPIDFEESKGRIIKEIRKATTDCKNLNDEAWKESKRLAIVFVLPYVLNLRESISGPEIERYWGSFKNQIREFSKRQKAYFLAIHYADAQVSRNVYSTYNSTNPKWGWCPGIAVIGKFVDHN